MKKTLNIKYSFFIFWVACVSYANAPTHLAFNEKITQMIKQQLPEATVGVIVQEAETGKIIYNYHGTKHFLPASTTKLFTAAAALKELGPDFCYDTTLYYNPEKLSNDTYKGDIAVKFTGDPSFKVVYLYGLLGKLSKASIKSIQGDLIIDDTIFEGPLLGNGWTWDSAPWHHSAPVSAIIIDRNQFGVTLYPAQKIGENVIAKLEQVYASAKFRSLKTDIRSVTYEDSETICQLNTLVDDQNNVELNGCWPIGGSPAHLRLAVRDPRLHAKRLINEALIKLNIKLNGDIKFSKVPSNLTKLAHHSSEPLYVLLNAILGDSNNLYAESLTKTLGAQLYGKGSFKTGSLAVRRILSDITGIDFSQTRLLDGSGASRYNLLTPQHLSRLLYTMHHEEQLNKPFREALAISGVNGTLKTRFSAFDTKSNIKAKTGSLSGVSALSGYMTTNSGKELIVTIMINHSVMKGAVLKQFENDLCCFLIGEL